MVERELPLPVPQVGRARRAPGHGPRRRRSSAGGPRRRSRVVGVTGTNGKTTSAFLMRAVLEAAGRPCGLIGTIEARVGGEVVPVTHTTPDAGGAAGPAGPDARRRRHAPARWRSPPTRSSQRADRGHAVRGGPVHQPHARPPRLPPHRRRLLRGQAGAVPAPGGGGPGPARGRQPRRRDGPPPGAPRPAPWATPSTRRPRCGPSASAASPPGSPRASPPRGARWRWRARLRGRFNLANLTGRGRRGRAAGAAARGGRRRPRARWPGCPAGSRPSRAASRSR